jgi:recombination protein RecA
VRSRARKAKALENAISAIEKQFGKGSIMRLGTHDAVVDAEVI